MRPALLIVAFALFAGGCALPPERGVEEGRLVPVPFHRVRVDDPFWNPRLKTNRTATLEACLARCEETGRIANFGVAGGVVEGGHKGRLYNDSDLYKVLEGAAYTLRLKRDPALEKRLDRIIDLIAAAQREDGYLNTYYTLVKPMERWKNIAHGHELYCAGHLFEAAVAYHRATGKRKLLEVARRLADHIGTVFGPGRRHDPPGHQEIELALVRLGEELKEPRYLELARFFVEQRGRSEGRKLYGRYCQDHLPVREQREVAGHAVRATYQYCAMADLVARRPDPAMRAALEALWTDVVERKMYITGGVGSSGHNEGFTKPYDLPNDSAYCESCAAIGMALWHHRMFLLSGEGRYADRLEQVLYNGLLAGVSLAGDTFFYRNPLGSRGDHHRTRWYSCACCPPNLLRYIAGLGGRIYAHRGDGAYVVLYVGSEATLPLAGGKVGLKVTTNYPWTGRVRIAVNPEMVRSFPLHLRVPDWFEGAMGLTLNGTPLKAGPVTAGFMRLERTWKPGDVVEMVLAMPVRRLHADPRVAANRGRTALRRGPLVYCLEGVDNGGRVRNLVLPPTAKIGARFAPGLLGGVVTLHGPAAGAVVEGGKVAWQRREFTAVPYHLWDNRAGGEMVVWIPEERKLAEPAGLTGINRRTGDGWLAASHLWRGDSLEALADGKLPRNSADHELPRFTWWPRKGSTEWVERVFDGSRTVRRVGVYWFDDRPRGGCRRPESWRLLVWKGEGWQPVALEPGQVYGVDRDALQEVTFTPVETTRIRLEVKLQEGRSGGILEWQVK